MADHTDCCAALHIRFWKREINGDYSQALARHITAAAIRAIAQETAR